MCCCCICMEKLELIDFGVEDDSLLSATAAVSEKENAEPFENVSPSSSDAVDAGGMISVHASSGYPELSAGCGSFSTAGAHLKGNAVQSKSSMEINVQRNAEEMKVDNLSSFADGPRGQDGKHFHGHVHQRLEGVTGGHLNVPEVPVVAMKKTRSTRASSLRKSLAWDKAFLTDEGVLDVDELPLVAKIPRKRPNYPLDIPNLPNLPGKASPAHLDETPKIIANYESADHMGKSSSSPVQDSPNIKALSCKGSSPAMTSSNLEANLSKTDSVRPVAVNQIVKADAVKATRLRLPSRFTGKREQSKEPPKTCNTSQDALRRCKSSSSVLSSTSASSLLSKKVSSVSKKVKDTLGRVLPGNFGGTAQNSKESRGSSFGDRKAALAVKTIGLLGNVLGSPVSAAISSKSGRGLVAGTSVEVTTLRKTAVRSEMSNLNATAADISAKVVPSSRGLTRLKDAGPSASTCSKGAPAPRKATEKPYSSNVVASPIFSPKRRGAAASDAPTSKKLTPRNVSQKNAESSSSLRVPSPKIGFFDTTRPSTGDQPSKLFQRVRETASDGSSSARSNSRNGLPPLPSQGLVPGRAGRTPIDNNLAVVASCLARSGIPSAPHLRSFSSPEKRLDPSFSPHRRDRNQRSPAPYRSVTSRDRSSARNLSQGLGSISEADPYVLQTQTIGTMGELVAGSSDIGCHRFVSVAEEGGVHTFGTSIGLEAEDKYKCRSSSGQFAGSSGILSSGQSSVDLPSSCMQWPGLLENSGSACRFSPMANCPGSQIVQGSGVIDIAVVRDDACGNARDASTMSSDLKQENVCRKLPLDKDLEISSFRYPNVACCPEPDVALRDGIVEGSMGKVESASQDEVLRPHESPPDVTKIGFERTLVHTARHAHSDHESSDREKKSISGTNYDTEKQVQVLGKCLHPSPPETEEANSKIGLFVDSPSRLSDGPVLESASPFSDVTSAVEQLTPSITPVLERFSGPGTSFTGDTPQQRAPESFISSPSPAVDLDCQTGKYPLTANPGLLNSSGQHTPHPPLKRERHSLSGFAQSTSESTFGQENCTVLEGQTGGMHFHKSKQRRASSIQRPEQSEASGLLVPPFPFSDDRLRLFEAAGQESLQMKSGAVQHSPPNKKSPLPNPWSPVKRNGHQLGPFDCTKKSSTIQ